MALISDIARKGRTVRRCGALALLLCAAAAWGNDEIAAETRQLRQTGQLSYPNIPIADAALLVEFYERRSFTPAWDSDADIAMLLTVFRASAQDGLQPADYHLARIGSTRDSLAAGRRLTERGSAAFDIMLTDGLARLVNDLHHGKVGPPPVPAQGDSSDSGERDPLADLEALVATESLSSAINEVLPRSRHYLRLRAALNRYRAIREAGGWPVVTDGPTIAPGERDARLALLAERLATTGDLQGGPETFPWYTEELEAAVRRFQARHGLDADGEVGRATLRAMNVPVDDRIDQLRVNLERTRWSAGDAQNDVVRVNIPAYRADLVRDGAVAWATRVIVGEPETETPELCSEIRYIVLNPTWTVPHSIASEELLGDIQNDPGFLARGGYDVFDREGNVVDPAGIDWAGLSANYFPYTLVQQPGPVNQLGQLKFVFPNSFAVYMHDTVARRLFEYDRRAFSHGCIRVDKPVDLAAELLGPEGWTRRGIETQIASAETRTVFLTTPMPVVVDYMTAEVDDVGTVRFHADIYDLDSAILEALDAPVTATPAK